MERKKRRKREEGRREVEGKKIKTLKKETEVFL